jgi:hypothetical protein
MPTLKQKLEMAQAAEVKPVVVKPKRKYKPRKKAEPKTTKAKKNDAK